MTHCWIARYEADGYTDSVKWAADHADTIEEPFRSMEYGPWIAAESVCMLEDGHDGPHDFVTSDEIRVGFADMASEAETTKDAVAIARARGWLDEPVREGAS